MAPFLVRHPEITLDLRFVRNPKDPLAALVDVLVFVGWIADTDLVARRCGQMQYVTCAAPAYWRARGVPRDPEELRKHDCLALRSRSSAPFSMSGSTGAVKKRAMSACRREW